MVDKYKGLSQHLPGAPTEWVKRLVESDETTDSIEQATKVYHAPTITPNAYVPAPGFGPITTPFGNVMTLVFDNLVNDAAFRIFKIDEEFVGDASFHIHWTKSANAAEAGSPSVTWLINYTVFKGDESNFVTGVPPDTYTNAINYTDTYDDASSGIQRIVYRTPDLPADGFQPGYYCGVQLTAISSGFATSFPACISMDLIWRSRVLDGV